MTDGTIKRIVYGVVAFAAVIYIAQFAWSFKTAADDRRAAEDARFHEIIKRRTDQAAQGYNP